MSERIKVVCLECGKKFSVSPKNVSPDCPKCGGADIEVADYVGLRAAVRPVSDACLTQAAKKMWS